MNNSLRVGALAMSLAFGGMAACKSWLRPTYHPERIASMSSYEYSAAAIFTKALDPKDALHKYVDSHHCEEALTPDLRAYCEVKQLSDCERIQDSEVRALCQNDCMAIHDADLRTFCHVSASQQDAYYRAVPAGFEPGHTFDCSPIAETAPLYDVCKSYYFSKVGGGEASPSEEAAGTLVKTTPHCKPAGAIVPDGQGDLCCNASVYAGEGKRRCE